MADDTPPSDPPPSDSPPKRSRAKRIALRALVAMPIVGVLLWVAVHSIPGFGPMLANGLRAVFGKKAVARLEDVVYGAQDFVLRRTRKDAKPETLWEVPSAAPAPVAAPTASVSGSAAAPSGPPPFKLADVGPIHPKIAAEGDGRWLPLSDPRKPTDRVRMLKTALHPDAVRSWAVVAIVAFDLRTTRIVPMAGRFEPKSKTPEAKTYKRKAVIPKEDWGRTLAAFNGGYKSTHGDYGMRIDGVTLTPPRALACTVYETKDGALRIAPWKDVKGQQDSMRWLRQTPICMYASGKAHPALSMPSIGWGASTVSKTTVIRRSAIGLSKDGKVAYVGIGDFVTGLAIGTAMRHAGAEHVAQLDVNFSFPKFVLYDFAKPGEEMLRAVPLTKRFEFTEDQYVGTRSHRDFFYVVRREAK